ncbi:hypothetical protein CVT25_010523 [Psilocybe cyanescens]|uniref:Uncharacterized protein n=1 Tax=Psilocybe cyanescens TaxID=93625 RepID=A0A409X2M1_PSICY|nr:hypothetical protein CVT25_010523 [Psilocybe cyanescens]
MEYKDTYLNCTQSIIAHIIEINVHIWSGQGILLSSFEPGIQHKDSPTSFRTVFRQTTSCNSYVGVTMFARDRTHKGECDMAVGFNVERLLDFVMVKCISFDILLVKYKHLQ